MSDGGPIGPREGVSAYPGESSDKQMKLIRLDIRGSTIVPDELKEPIIQWISRNKNGFLEQHRKHRPDGVEFQIGQLGSSYWAIKHDNLRLVEILAAAALAIAGFATVSAASPVVFAISLLAGIVALADRLKRKGVSLTEEQYAILMTLKVTGPATTDDLAVRLSGLHIFGEKVWTKERTEEALQTLKSKRLLDGTIDDLVTQANDHMWSTNGI